LRSFLPSSTQNLCFTHGRNLPARPKFGKPQTAGFCQAGAFHNLVSPLNLNPNLNLISLLRTDWSKIKIKKETQKKGNAPFPGKRQPAFAKSGGEASDCTLYQSSEHGESMPLIVSP
jgi:hypothetical protein